MKRKKRILCILAISMLYQELVPHCPLQVQAFTQSLPEAALAADGDTDAYPETDTLTTNADNDAYPDANAPATDNDETASPKINAPANDGNDITYPETNAPANDGNDITYPETNAPAADNNTDTYLEAKNAFTKLAADHDVYALLYQCGSYDIREAPASDSASVAQIQSGHSVRLTGVEFIDGEPWYQVEAMVNGIFYCGYIQDAYLISADEGFRKWSDAWNAADEGFQEWKDDRDAAGSQKGAAIPYAGSTDLNAFPASYQPYLQSLIAAHPNWSFVPMDTGLDWSTVVRNEMTPARNLVPLGCMESWKMSNQVLSAPDWVQASEAIVCHYLDPRNFLNEDTVFSFELLTFNSACHTESGVRAILKDTFMEKGTLENGLDYAQTFLQIGQELNISPYHLAGRVRQEQGVKGDSPLISGTFPGYEGYYNYYNIQASGATYDEIIHNGLEEAKAGGWTTRYAALYGGSRKVCNNYIKAGQNTLYLQKFDVDNSDGSLYWHQYMQNLLVTSTESRSVRKGYQEMGVLDNSFVFRVPVYHNMPATACGLPKDSLAAPALRISISNYEKVVLKWRDTAEMHGYWIYRSTRPDSGFKKVATINSGQTSSWTDKTGINKTYYYKIRGWRNFTLASINSPYSSVEKGSTKLPAPQAASLTLSSYDKITVKWEKLKSVSGYRIYRKANGSSSYKLLKKVTGAAATSYTDKDILPNSAYSYKIKAYKTVKGKTYYSPYSNAILANTNLARPTLRSANAISPTKVKLSWPKVAGVKGYQIYRSGSYKGKYTRIATIDKNSTLSYTDSGLTPNKAYFYKIRAYGTAGKTTQYSKFSSIAGITPRLEAPAIKSVSGISTDKAKLSWKEVTGAQGYRIYRSSSLKGPYKLAGTASKNTFTDTGLSRKKTYYYKVRAYVKASGTYHYSGFSDIWSVQAGK